MQSAGCRHKYNTRTPVSIVFENLEAGMSIDEITEQYPVTREQINTVLEFAAKSVAPPPPPRLKTPAL